MSFGFEDFLSQFLAWTMLSGAIMTASTAIAMILHHRWLEYRYPDQSAEIETQPQPFPIHVRKTMSRSDLWSIR